MAPVAHILARLFALLVTVLPAFAQDPAVTEAGVKAAFLYKFPSFLEWPATVLAKPEEPLVIAVAGSDDVLSELNTIAESRKKGRPLVAKPARDTSLSGVHVLFIGARERARAPELVRAAQQAGALAVTEWDGALNTGSVINFVKTPEGRVRFEISLAAAEKSRLRPNSGLLSVAQHVVPTKP